MSTIPDIALGPGDTAPMDEIVLLDAPIPPATVGLAMNLQAGHNLDRLAGVRRAGGSARVRSRPPVYRHRQRRTPADGPPRGDGLLAGGRARVSVEWRCGFSSGQSADLACRRGRVAATG